MVNKKILGRLWREYSVGCRVELVEMEDTAAPPIGTRGAVISVDDIGSIMVAWDNGSGLNVLYGIDWVRQLFCRSTESIQ